MELKNGMTVISPIDIDDIEKGSEHVVFNVEKSCKPYMFSFSINVNGFEKYCLLNCCSHILDNNWIIKQATMNYDHDILGIGNPDHPANEKEYFEEEELTNLEFMRKGLNEVKSIYKQILEMEAKQGSFGILGMEEKELEKYHNLKDCLKDKINKL